MTPRDRQTDRHADRLTDLQTDTAMIGSTRLHLMHSMQPKTLAKTLAEKGFRHKTVQLIMPRDQEET